MADHHTRHNPLGQDALFATPASLMLDARLTPLERNGWQVLRMLRAVSGVPVIVITAQDDDRTVVDALDAGADDYVVKPFDGRLLAARIAAVLRRTAASQPDDPAIALGELRIDLDAMTVHRAGEPVSLSSTEFRLFETLLLNETAC